MNRTINISIDVELQLLATENPSIFDAIFDDKPTSSEYVPMAKLEHAMSHHPIDVVGSNGTSNGGSNDETHYVVPLVINNHINETTIKTKAILYISIIYVILAAVAIAFSNILIIYTIFSCQKLKNSRGFIKFSIALADVMVGLVVLPHSIVKAIESQLNTDHEELWGTPENCFFAILYCTSRSAAIQSTVLLLFDCWVQTTKPAVYKKMFTKRDCIPIISGIWILSFTCSLATIRNTKTNKEMIPGPLLHLKDTGWACCVYQIITTPGGFHVDESAFQFKFDAGFLIGFIIPVLMGIILWVMISNFQSQIKNLYLTKYRRLGRRASFVALEHVSHIWNGVDEAGKGVPPDVSLLVSKYIEARVSALNTKMYDDDCETLKEDSESDINPGDGEGDSGECHNHPEEVPCPNRTFLKPSTVPEGTTTCLTPSSVRSAGRFPLRTCKVSPHLTGRTQPKPNTLKVTDSFKNRARLSPLSIGGGSRGPPNQRHSPMPGFVTNRISGESDIDYEELRKDLQHNAMVKDWIAEKELAAEAVLHEPQPKAYFIRNKKIVKRSISSVRRASRSIRPSSSQDDSGVGVSSVGNGPNGSGPPVNRSAEVLNDLEDHDEVHYRSNRNTIADKLYREKSVQSDDSEIYLQNQRIENQRMKNNRPKLKRQESSFNQVKRSFTRKISRITNLSMNRESASKQLDWTQKPRRNRLARRASLREIANMTFDKYRRKMTRSGDHGDDSQTTSAG